MRDLFLIAIYFAIKGSETYVPDLPELIIERLQAKNLRTPDDVSPDLQAAFVRDISVRHIYLRSARVSLTLAVNGQMVYIFYMFTVSTFLWAHKVLIWLWPDIPRQLFLDKINFFTPGSIDLWPIAALYNAGSFIILFSIAAGSLFAFLERPNQE